MNARNITLIVLLVVLFLSACQRRLPLPTSGGRSYEVLVTGPDAAAIGMTAQSLNGITLSALPQEEQAFDVSTLVRSEMDEGVRYARNIVLVSTDSTHLPHTRIRYEQNVYAHPQTIIHIDAPSREQLAQDLPESIKQVADALTRAEMSNAIINLRNHHNAEAAMLVERLFACRLWIPQDLKLAKQADDFLWFSNNAARGMQNICIYRYRSDSLQRQEMLFHRDSIMALHIKGENDSTHMQTVAGSVEFRVKNSHNIVQLGARGLWHMQHSAMGGPFVSLAVQRGDSVLCVEGFVYAPEMRKRNLIRRLEATLYTLKDTNKEL